MIDAETVTRVLESVNSMTDQQAQMMTMQMSKEQPMVMAYLLAASEDEMFDRDEGQVLFFIGVAIWQIMKHVPGAHRAITEEQLERAEKANEDLLTKMASDSAGDFLSATQSLIENYPEPEVLGYVTRALMEDEEGNPDNPPFRDENLGLAFLNLKIVLDVFVGNSH